MVVIVMLRFDSLEEAEDFIDDLEDDVPAAMVCMDAEAQTVSLQ